MNFNIINNVTNITISVVSRVQGKREETQQNNNQYQHCQQQDLQHYVNCGVKSAR